MFVFGCEICDVIQTLVTRANWGKWRYHEWKPGIYKWCHRRRRRTRCTNSIVNIYEGLKATAILTSYCLELDTSVGLGNVVLKIQNSLMVCFCTLQSLRLPLSRWMQSCKPVVAVFWANAWRPAAEMDFGEKIKTWWTHSNAIFLFGSLL